MKKKAKGLGDTISKITEATGVKALVDKVSEITGVDCGCSRRQEALNTAFPYQNVEHPIQLPINQNINDFTPGLYRVYNNLVMTNDDQTITYKIGDYIYIDETNHFYNQFQTYYQLGVIK